MLNSVHMFQLHSCMFSPDCVLIINRVAGVTMTPLFDSLAWLRRTRTFDYVSACESFAWDYLMLVFYCVLAYLITCPMWMLTVRPFCSDVGLLFVCARAVLPCVWF